MSCNPIQVVGFGTAGQKTVEEVLKLLQPHLLDISYDPADKKFSERVMRIELTLPAWEAGVLPLNYTRLKELKKLSKTGNN